MRSFGLERFAFFLWLSVLTAVEPLAAQEPARYTERYIERVFEAQIGEVPKLGWFSPLHGFVAPEGAANVTIYSPLGMPSDGKKKRSMSGTEITDLRRIYRLACEHVPADVLTVFDAGVKTDTARALFPTKRLPGEIRTGLLTIQLGPGALSDVNRLLGWPAQGTLRRDEAFGVSEKSFFYSIHRLYNRTTGLLNQEAIVLHASDGKILTHDLTREIDSSMQCDGCILPSYSEAFTMTYRPLNLFELPGFTYPVLLLDTSTSEGRALSLLTFTPGGKLAEFRIYEYVVHC